MRCARDPLRFLLMALRHRVTHTERIISAIKARLANFNRLGRFIFIVSWLWTACSSDTSPGSASNGGSTSAAGGAPVAGGTTSGSGGTTSAADASAPLVGTVLLPLDSATPMAPGAFGHNYWDWELVSGAPVVGAMYSAQGWRQDL